MIGADWNIREVLVAVAVTGIVWGIIVLWGLS